MNLVVPLMVILYEQKVRRQTFGRSDLLSREMADKVRTAVTPKVILSLVASLSQTSKTMPTMFALLTVAY